MVDLTFYCLYQEVALYCSLFYSYVLAIVPLPRRLQLHD